MLNQDTFYHPLFPQYVNGSCENYFFPYKYNSKAIKKCNCYIPLEGEKSNSEEFYILTEKNNKLTANQNALNGLISENLNRRNFKEYNSQQFSVKNTNKDNKSLINKNYSGIDILNYIPLSNRIKGIRNQSPKEDSQYNNLLKREIKNNKNKNCLRKKYSSIALSNYNQPIKPDINNSSYFNFNNNSISCYSESFQRHNSHTLLRKDFHNTNNTLNAEISTKNEYKENNFDIEEKRLELNINENKDIEYIPINYHTYNNNFISSRTKISEKFNKNRAVIIKYNNNSNVNNFPKKYICSNNSYFNKDENQISYPSINRNISYSKIENIDIENRLVNKCPQNETKKKMVINSINRVNNNNLDYFSSNKNNGNLKKIKKISLISFPNCQHIDKKTNHSFYEIKSLSKGLKQETQHKIFNNTEVINSVCKNKKEINYKVNDEKIGNSLNVKIYEGEWVDKNVKGTCDLKEVYNSLRNNGKSNLHGKKSKNTIENANKSEINVNDFKSIKENINTNNINMNSLKFYTYNENNFVLENKVNKSKKLEINLGNSKCNNSKGITKYNKINKKLINNNGKNAEYKENIIVLNRKKIVSHIPSRKIDPKKISKNKINSNHFSFLPSVKDNKNKKKKKFFDKKNIIQLNNINNKVYAEDFPLKENDKITNLNTILKPQISVRIALLGNKEPENEKYFLVNFFYSENIRDKPDESESEFY